MPLLDPKVRKPLKTIRKSIKRTSVRNIPKVRDLNGTISEINPLKRRLRGELKQVLKLIDSGKHPQLSAIVGLRAAVLSAMQHLKRPGGPPLSGDNEP